MPKHRRDDERDRKWERLLEDPPEPIREIKSWGHTLLTLGGIGLFLDLVIWNTSGFFLSNAAILGPLAGLPHFVFPICILCGFLAVAGISLLTVAHWKLKKLL